MSLLYVDNLPDGATDEQIRKAFLKFGNVKVAQVVRDKSTGDSRGIGFVMMESAGGALRAIAGLHLSRLGGFRLRVGPARPDRRR